jgi:ACS family sodium-dependent inorganic phosphate cotransporter
VADLETMELQARTSNLLAGKKLQRVVLNNTMYKFPRSSYSLGHVSVGDRKKRFFVTAQSNFSGKEVSNGNNATVTALTLSKAIQKQFKINTEDAPSRNEDVNSLELYQLVGMATAVCFICAIDRAAMSVTILPMSQYFHWDESVKGSVSSAFFAGYMITNIFGGYLATKYCPRVVLASGVVMWSLFTLETPTAAASDSLTNLFLVRAIMGVGEGVAYPSIQNIVRGRVPDYLRSRSLSLIYSGHQLGTIVSYMASPALMSTFGWQSVFLVFGSLGFVWLAGWIPMILQQKQPLTKSSPRLEPRSGEKGAEESIPWRKIAASRSFWAIVCAQVSTGVGAGLSFSWLPTYFSELYHIDPTQAAYLCLLPFSATVIATNCSGWIADGLVNNGTLTLTQTRKLMQAIASFGPAVCLMRLGCTSDLALEPSMNNGIGSAVILVTCWLALGGFSAAGYGTNHQDLSKKWAGMLFGLSNGLASIAGSASIYATGLILQNSNNDWNFIFESAAVIYLIGAVLYIKFASCEEEF